MDMEVGLVGDLLLALELWVEFVFVIDTHRSKRILRFANIITLSHATPQL